MNLRTILLSLLLLSLTYEDPLSYDDQPTLPKKIRLKPRSRLLQQTITNHYLNIDIDEKDLVQWMRYGQGEFFAKYLVVRKNLMKVQKYIESHFKVDFLEGGFDYPSFVCGRYGNTFPGGTTTKDLYVKVMVESNSSVFYAAAASSCLAWEVNNRPLVGMIIVNTHG